jgi:hypothetical protein
MSSIPTDRQAALKKLGAEIGLKTAEPMVHMTGFRVSRADHRFWMELSKVHDLNASATLSVMIEAYLERHQEDFIPWSGVGAVLPIRYGRFALPRRLAELLKERCAQRLVTPSDCIRQVINWTSGLID